jgi:transposase
MSKRRLVVTAVLAGSSQSQAARDHGVSQGWISRVMARYHLEGEAAFQPRSRRPHTTPTATPAETVEKVLRLRKQLVEDGLDSGADTIRRQPNPRVSLEGCRYAQAVSAGVP